MRVFLTGGTGFIGGRVARLLRERGDDVVALVRSPARATALVGLGCELTVGDVTDSFSVERAMNNAEAVIHLAGRYEIGIPKRDCPEMQDVNIGGVRHVLDAAITANVPRIIHASSVVVFGDTQGQRVTETYRRNPLEGFLSCYDESKYRAHVLAEDRINKGAPIIIVQPGAVLGSGDHSEVGRQVLQAAHGQLSSVVFGELGLTVVHADDVAAGIVRALDAGVVGQSYILGGDSVRAMDMIERAADLAGQKRPKRKTSSRLLSLIAPIGPWVAPKLGYPPNVNELIRSAHNVTYWADDSKARFELAYDSRSLDDCLREFLIGSGVRLDAGAD